MTGRGSDHPGDRVGDRGGSAFDDPPVAIGPYRILAKLGEGAMGVVYRAEQQQPLRREVALKILKPGVDTAQVVARFEAERQALAVMEHPGIARVFDAGRTESGLPYFVMERVDGPPVTRWCDERRLGVRDRVELFAQICRVVQHAHQKGVIHRDLKPSNILVTEGDDGTPQPKVIDFGIARAVEPTDDVRLTAMDQTLGTPAYMSPEQARASDLDVDTRTDIYSLGVLLYELLVGALPFEPTAYRGWALLAHHLEKDPPRPSHRLRGLDDADTVAGLRGATPDALVRALKGDLDWVALKAMEKDRERRYETANGLAMDVERYLASEPVVARPPSAGYRARRFARRHRSGVAVSAVGVLLLAGFGAAMAVQAQRIAAARDVAESRRTQAEGLIDFMLGDLRSKLAPIGRLEILDDIGDEAVAYFAALPESEFSDAELLSRSRALEQIGQVRLDEGRPADAEEALRESLRLARELSARSPDDLDRLFQLSQSHFWVGYAAWLRDELIEAETQFRGYLDTAERLVALEPDNLDYRLELGFAHSNLGSVREARGDLAGAADAFALTLDVKRELVDRDPTRVDWLGELAETHNTLAVVYRKQGRYGQALEEHERELELKRRVLEQSPGHAYWRFRLGVAHYFISLLESAVGEVGPAIEDARVAAIVVDSLTHHDPDNASWRLMLARVQEQLGLALASRGETAEALAVLDAARARVEPLVRLDPAATEGRSVLALVQGGRARLLTMTGRPDDAVDAARAAADLLADAPDDHMTTTRYRARTEIELGRALQATGRSDEADAVIASAIDRLTGLGDHAEAAELRPLLAEAYVLAGRRSDARAQLDRLRGLGYREPLLMQLVAEHGLGDEG
ncbi:MAG: protein kinase domain-containing protein [Candidatus Longimicrobiales bacterium M2_2A_002]